MELILWIIFIAKYRKCFIAKPSCKQDSGFYLMTVLLKLKIGKGKNIYTFANALAAV